MEKIQLVGGQIHITNHEKTSFLIEEGTVLVYLLPCQNEIYGRRLLVHEMNQGKKIPSFSCQGKNGEIFRFGLVALEKATIVEMDEPQMELVQQEFARTMGMRTNAFFDFEEQMLELYDMNLVKEEGYIYAIYREQIQTKKKNLHLILDMFGKKTNRIKEMQLTGNDTYDAVSYLCDVLKIDISSYDRVKQYCKRKVTLEDISRVSHFPTRRITLEKDWYKRDGGCFIAYLKKNNQAIACITRGNGKYYAYDPKTDKLQLIKKELAESFGKKADMIYRPFPLKQMNWWDLLRFGIGSIRMSDVVYFVITTFLGTMLGLLMPVLNSQLYDRFIPMSDKSGLAAICLLFIVMALGNISFIVVKNLAKFRCMKDMEYAVESAAYDRLFHLPEKFFREYDSGDLAMRLMGIATIFRVCVNAGMEAIITAFFSLLYVFQMFSYATFLAIPAVIMLVSAIIVIGYIGFRQTRYENERMDLESEISSTMYQFMAGVSKIRVTGAEDRAVLRYLQKYTKIRKITVKKETLNIIVDILITVANIVFLMVLYYLVIQQRLKIETGVFVGFVTSFGALSAAMLSMVSTMLDINLIIPTYDKCLPILTTLPEYESTGLYPGNISGAIEVNNVSFAYSENTGDVLKQLSFQIQPGEYVAIVGESGCGKSTLLKMLLGFEKAEKGNIFYDGKSIDMLDKKELRRKIGVVLQDGALIDGSIYDNITIMAHDLTKEKVEKIIEMVGLKEDIAQFPLGLNTLLSEDSVSISGGQKQRILIARAIASNPAILFLDEATSALDNVTQALVCKNLAELKMTRIVIAHRLSTVINCDRILVMKDGKIVEEGDYKYLMEKKGLFYQLANRQMI